ncbi:AraC family transcriptional regulator [Salmonella enterica subsp. enterica]|nr:AraC family transcriptional regulator [Salmonella enterica subsp. enterica]
MALITASLRYRSIRRVVPVLHGDIEEIALPGGICITRSDVHVLQPYETTSRHSSPLYMLVVLEGNVALAVNEQTFFVERGDGVLLATE